MQHQTLVSINGKITPSHLAQISIFDRGFLFGDSIYEATLFKNNVALFWQEHIKRLYNSAALIKMPLNIQVTRIEQWIEELAKNFTSTQGYLRLVVTRGEGAVNLNPNSFTENNVLLYLAPLHIPQEWYQNGQKFFISTFERNSIKSLNPQAKTGNYLNSQLALMEGKSQGYDDSLLINAQGFITEGTTNNFWFIQGNTIYTPDPNQGLLKGITRDKILDIIKTLGLNIKIGAWTIDQAIKADEAFITSSTKGVVPVVKLSQWDIGKGIPGQTTLNIRNAYEAKVDLYFKMQQWKSH